MNKMNNEDNKEIEEVTYVITRSGKKEPLDTNQIVIRLQKLISRAPKIKHVNPYDLMLKVVNATIPKLSSDSNSFITTSEIDEECAHICANLSLTNPYYLALAGRIAVDNHQKSTKQGFYVKMKDAYNNRDEDGAFPLISDSFFSFVTRYCVQIEEMIDYSRDFLLDYFGIKMFQKSYSIKINDKPIERPQDLFMREAIQVSRSPKPDSTPEEIEEILNEIKEAYDLLSNKLYTHGSPTCYNSGGKREQLASCFLLGSGDSLEEIEKTGFDSSQISKWAGGIGIHTHDWRSSGSRIRGTNGRSSGIVPFLRTYETRLQAFNQGGRRPGSAAIYLMPHHPDILDFLDISKHNGDEKMRARDLFTAIWIPDIFMERVSKNEMWSLFDPRKCGDLSAYYGDEYTTRYLQLEAEKKYSRQMKARDLWEHICQIKQLRGFPYICFSDHANRMSMHKNLGTVKSSNLCVTGNTKVLTDHGDIDIYILVNTNNGVHNVWNGQEFTPAQFSKTSDSAELIKLHFSDMTTITCTPDHRWPVFSTPHFYEEMRTHELQVGDKFLKHGTNGFVFLENIQKLDYQEATYCFNEPKRHMGLFNGILGFNCSEIFLYSDTKEYATCVLGSIALPNFVFDGYSEDELKKPENERRVLDHEFPVNPYFDYERLVKVVKIVTRNLNNVVDKTYSPVMEAKRGNERHRPIGIGIQGLDDAYAKMRFPFDSVEAADLNKKIFETIYYAALSKSSEMCRKEWQKLKKKCAEQGYVTVKVFRPEDYDEHEDTYVNPQEIPKRVAAYSSIDWNGGSPIGNNVFHWELYGLKPEQLSGMWDWESLRIHIQEFGVKNSLLVALMPTASTSQLLGCNECFEPVTSNIYTRDTIAGQYIIIKKYLIHDLFKLNLWNNDLKDVLMAEEGSIQNIGVIPDEIKRLYKTAYEIDQKVLVQQAIERQPFVDQGQSLNLYLAPLTLTAFTKLMFQAWRGNLKTGNYYMHSEAAVMPQKFTLDPRLLDKVKMGKAQNVHIERGNAVTKKIENVCDSCSG
jgi:ribonucleotide reductase alpha subunit